MNCYCRNVLFVSTVITAKSTKFCMKVKQSLVKKSGALNETPSQSYILVLVAFFYQNLTNLYRSEGNALRSQSNVICSDASEKI